MNRAMTLGSRPQIVHSPQITSAVLALAETLRHSRPVLRILRIGVQIRILPIDIIECELCLSRDIFYRKEC